MTKMMIGGCPGGGGVFGHHQARLHQSSGVKLRKFQRFNRHSVSVDPVNWHPRGYWASQSPELAEYYRLNRLKLVNVLHVGSAEPSMTKMVN